MPSIRRLRRSAVVSLAVGAVCALAVSSANAVLSGNQLKSLLDDYWSQGGLYIIGVVESYFIAARESNSNARPARCFYIPPGANGTQLSDIVKAFLRDNPARRHEDAAVLTLDALTQAFPCTRQQ